MNLIALMSLFTTTLSEDKTAKDYLEEGLSYLEEHAQKGEEYFDSHIEEGKDYLDEHAQKGEEYFNSHMEEGKDYLEEHAQKGEEYFDSHMEEGFDHLNDKTKSDLGTKLSKVYTNIKTKIFKLFK